MKSLSLFVLSLVALTLNVGAAGEDKNSAAQNGSFITLKPGDGREFRAFVAGPADAKAAVLIVHDYFIGSSSRGGSRHGDNGPGTDRTGRVAAPWSAHYRCWSRRQYKVRTGRALLETCQ